MRAHGNEGIAGSPAVAGRSPRRRERDPGQGSDAPPSVRPHRARQRPPSPPLVHLQRAMQPSQFEIQREVENLRDIRRRSTTQGGPGALIIDPDLPEQSPLQPAEHWVPSPTSADDHTSQSSHDDSDEILSTPADDPSSLFWVPARLHPEIDPSEFRAFLKEHTRTSSEAATPSLSRAGSTSSTYSFNGNLGRKKSMLSKQYDPTRKRDSGDEEIKPLRRNRTSVYQNVPQLTISDLQRLEELAEEASQSDDPSKLRSMLRRSLSMNVSPSVIDQMDDMPMGDDVDAPIIVPPPNQILRRAARTKIRKAGTAEGPHTFSGKRRFASGRTPDSKKRESDISSSDHTDEMGTTRRPSLTQSDSGMGYIDTAAPPVPVLPSPVSPPQRPQSFSNEPMRPMSFSEEASIYDAYARDDYEDEPYSAMSPPQQAIHEMAPVPILEPEYVLPPVVAAPPAPVPVPAPGPELHHPQPQRLAPPQTESPGPSRTPSPDAPSVSSSLDGVSHLRTGSSEAPIPYSAKSPPHGQSAQARKEKEKEKDKKGFFKWGKGKEKEKEKDTGFLGSLFGGGKKKQDEAGPAIGSGAGRETAAALLGASKSSRAYAPSPSPQPQGGNYARYPIHVERAIYRLSHIKLANPRRPLYEQVLISNLMFWYLGVINKAQQQPAAPAQGAAAPQPAADGAAAPQPVVVAQPGAAEAEKEQREKEQREREERERAEKERQAERERQAEQKREPRRGTLTKAPPAGTPPTRRAEMPVRGPQYERQHRAMEFEQGYGSGAPPGSGANMAQPGRPTSTPPSTAGPPYRSGSPARTAHSGPPPLMQPQQTPSGNHYYEGNGGAGEPRRQQQAQLPPGAMPPASMEQGWQQPQPVHPGQSRRSASPGRAASISPPGSAGYTRTSHSPPPLHHPQRHDSRNHLPSNGGGKSPSRSLSAAATPPPVVNGVGMNGKRSQSAHATPPGGHRSRPGGEKSEEDVPLAMWQQQRRR